MTGLGDFYYGYNRIWVEAQCVKGVTNWTSCKGNKAYGTTSPICVLCGIEEVIKLRSIENGIYVGIGNDLSA